ncbi:uncharacterized protein [Haliotis asinina]|uniref:uncharacterized protein n=1 Tax=Haliotis asinina TaxID=109174 RepID=UPI003531D54C
MLLTVTLHSAFILGFLSITARCSPLRTWENGHTLCQRRGGMIVPRDGSLEDLRGVVVGGTHVWLGGRKMHTSWTWQDGSPLYMDVGCYVLPPTLTLNHRGVTEVFDCYLQCKQKYTFAVISETSCRCLDYIGNLSKADMGKCDQRCSHNAGERCGGSGYGSIYRQPDLYPWSAMNTDSSQCGYLYKPPQHPVVMMADLCGTKVSTHKPAFCQKDGNISVDMTYSTWEQACPGLTKAHATRMDILPFKNSQGTQEYYWIGLSRNTAWHWSNGSSAESLLQRLDTDDLGGDCLAAYKDVGEKIHLSTLPCSAPVTVVCASDLQPTTQTSSTSPDPDRTPAASSKSTSSTTGSIISTTDPGHITPSNTLPLEPSPTPSLPPSSPTTFKARPISSSTTPSSTKTSSSSTMITWSFSAAGHSHSESIQPSTENGIRGDGTSAATPSQTHTTIGVTHESVSREASKPHEENTDLKGLYIGVGVIASILLLVLLVLLLLQVYCKNRSGQSQIYRVRNLTKRHLSNSSTTSVSRENLVNQKRNSVWGDTEKRVRLQSVKDAPANNTVRWRDDNWGFEVDDGNDSVFEDGSPTSLSPTHGVGMATRVSLGVPDPVRAVHFEDEARATPTGMDLNRKQTIYPRLENL